MKNTTTLSRMYVPSCHGGKIHIESEVILPDYCPDAAKIVKTELSPKITSQSCFPDDGGLNISLDGTALFKVLYLSDGDSGLCSTFFTQPFSHSFKVRTDESTDMENIFDCVTLSTENASCRTSSSRKAVIKGDISVIPQLKLNSVREFFGGGDTDTETRGSHVPVCRLISSAESDFTLSEKITLPENLPSAADILDCSMRYVCDSTKCAEGKVIFTATAYFTCFYRSDEGTVSFCQPIEISQITDMPSCDSTHTAEVFFLPTSLRADTDVDNYGENRIIAVDFSYTAKTAVYGNELFYAVTDAFCPGHDYTSEYDEITLKALECKICEHIPVKGSLKLKIPETVSIENICPSVHLRGWVIENGIISLDARLNLKMISALSGSYDGMEENLDFSAKIPLDNPEICKCDLYADVNDVSCILSANSVEVMAEVTINGAAYTQSRIKCVKEMSVGDKKPYADRPPIILYYPSENETLWDVAKSYSLPIKALMEYNGMEGEKITEPVVKIPRI